MIFWPWPGSHGAERRYASPEPKPPLAKTLLGFPGGQASSLSLSVSVSVSLSLQSSLSFLSQSFLSLYLSLSLGRVMRWNDGTRPPTPAVGLPRRQPSPGGVTWTSRARRCHAAVVMENAISVPKGGELPRERESWKGSLHAQKGDKDDLNVSGNSGLTCVCV